MKNVGPYWIWANEPSTEDEAMIYGVPPDVDRLDLSFDKGVLVSSPVPLITMSRNADSQGTLTDNLIAPGMRGLVFSSRLRSLLAIQGIDNVQYFPLVLTNPADGSETADYRIANLLGLVSCLDSDRVEGEWDDADPTRLVFFDGLPINEHAAHDLKMFRLAEFPQAVVVADRVRQACEGAGITGVRFYAPEEYSL